MIHCGVISRLLGRLLCLFGLALSLPLLISGYYQDGQYAAYLYGMVCAWGVGGVLICCGWDSRESVLRTDGFILVVLAWVLMSVCACIPFYYGLDVSVYDALFEAVSGFNNNGG